jgi:hypothetical protein
MTPLSFPNSFSKVFSINHGPKDLRTSIHAPVATEEDFYGVNLVPLRQDTGQRRPKPANAGHSMSLELSNISYTNYFRCLTEPAPDMSNASRRENGDSADRPACPQPITGQVTELIAFSFKCLFIFQGL